MNEVAVRDASLDAIKAMEDAGALTPTSLTLDENVTFEQYEALARWLGQVGRSVQWWIADLLNFGEAAFGDRYAAAAELTGHSHETLLTYAYVGRCVVRSRRREGLSFATHRLVAPLTPAQQRRWLDRAERNGWSSRRLAVEMRDEQDQEPTEQPAWDKAQPKLERAAREFAAATGRPVVEARETIMLAAANSTRVESLFAVVSDLLSLARMDGNGHVLVPIDDWARLAAALGDA